MGGFCDVKVPIVIGEDSAAYRRDAYRPIADIELIDNFTYQPVNDPVAATRAIVVLDIAQASGTGED
jgi:hypothetical protein